VQEEEMDKEDEVEEEENNNTEKDKLSVKYKLSQGVLKSSYKQERCVQVMCMCV
jgi:hypothetical protein